MTWVEDGGRYAADLPETIRAGNYRIRIKDKVTGENVERIAYRTSDKWGYLRDFKPNWKGRRTFLSSLLALPMPGR